jgi:hypothetical protein
VTGAWRRLGAFNAVVLLLAAFVVYLGLSNVERGVRAARADGVAGHFTASRLDCTQHPGHESCTCYGTYGSDDGTTLRDDVYMYGRDRRTCRMGVSVAAVDIGARTRVYGPEGSHEWVWTAGTVALGLGLGAWGASPLWRGRRP